MADSKNLSYGAAGDIVVLLEDIVDLRNLECEITSDITDIIRSTVEIPLSTPSPEVREAWGKIA